MFGQPHASAKRQQRLLERSLGTQDQVSGTRPAAARSSSSVAAARIVHLGQDPGVL